MSKVYQTIAAQQARIERLHNGTEILRTAWLAGAIAQRQKALDMLPSGSGFDMGTTLLSCTDEAMVFSAPFHHMDENGGYDGWTEHKVYVRATFDGFDIRVTGSNRNDIKEYIADTFFCALNDEVVE